MVLWPVRPPFVATPQTSNTQGRLPASAVTVLSLAVGVLLFAILVPPVVLWPIEASPLLIPIAQLVGAVLAFGLVGWVAFREVKRLQASQVETEQLAFIPELTHQPVLTTDAAGEIDWVNESFLQLTGLVRHDILGKSPGTALLGRPMHNAVTIQKIRDGMGERQPFTVEMQCAHKGGHRYWLSLSFTPVFDEQGEVARFIGIGADITERKLAEEELARTHRRNLHLLDAAGDGIVSLDVQGNICFTNPAAAQLTGWEPEELLGQPASAILHQLRVDKLPNVQDDLFTAAAFVDGTVLIGDTDDFRRKDGTHFPVEYVSTPLRETNQHIGAVIIFRDITDRRQSETLRAKQARMFALRADVAFALTAGDTLRNFLQRTAAAVVKHLDGAFARVWTLNTENDTLELQASAGCYVHIDGHHSRIPVGTMKVGLLAKAGVPQATNNLETDPTVIDREWVKMERMVAFAGYPLFVEGKLIGVMAMFSRNVLPDDALELLGGVADAIAQGVMRKRAEEKIAEQAALLDNSQSAILVIDTRNRCTYWNKYAEQLYGWTAAEASGQRADQLLFVDASYFEEARAGTLDHGAWRDECCQSTSGERTITVESQWTLIRDEEGRPKSILIVNSDISEKKKIEAQFLRTQRMESIGTLAGGIAHDLNNVLAPIMMSVEILKEKFKDDQSRRMLGILESSAKRGADMVKQVLTFARGVDGERVLLQTRHLIKDLAKIASETFPKNIQFQTQTPESLWPIMGDATQLHQVLLNLAVNARDAMPNGGAITISAENTIVEANQANPAAAKPGFYVVIKVTDTGTGIPREILDKIFEPFFTTKEMGKGTGLGLSTVLGIVKSHGGFLQVQTEPNKGTQFILYFPATENAQAQTADGEARLLPPGHGELILAVDDEAAVLSMTKETLEAFGYRVLTARDGTEAVATYSAHRHEIKGVLTDMLMPHMDGPATIRVLKKLDPGVRIIAASGLMDSERVKDATGLDNIAFLMKPYTTERLLHAIHKVLNETVPA